VGFVNEVDDDAPLTAVIFREGGVSSTPQTFGSITGVAEYWIVRRSLSSGAHSRDPVAGDDERRHSRDTMRPSFAKSFAPQNKRDAVRSQEGRREDRVRAAPAVSRARVANKNAHEHTGSAEAVRPSLRNGFTAYFVLSPARPGLLVTVIPKKLPS
jgi:hypothetical protein